MLPAVGGAFEDLARPDIEEADDRFFGDPADAREGIRHLRRNADPRLAIAL